MVRKDLARGKKIFQDTGHLESQDVLVLEGEGKAASENDEEQEIKFQLCQFMLLSAFFRKTWARSALPRRRSNLPELLTMRDGSTLNLFPDSPQLSPTLETPNTKCRHEDNEAAAAVAGGSGGMDTSRESDSLFGPDNNQSMGGLGSVLFGRHGC